MKLQAILLLAVVACACAGNDEDPWNNLIQEWKAVYGNYDTYYPLQYRLTRYTYPTYPVVQPSYPVVQPSYPIIQPAYPVPTYPTYPTYPKPIVTYPVRVKASYDPEYFNELYGYYPAY